NHSVVVLPVFGGGEEGDGAGGCCVDKLIDARAALLSPVAARELVNTRWVVAEPPPQLARRRHLLQPEVRLVVVAAPTAGPRPGHEDRCGVALLPWQHVVDLRDMDVHQALMPLRRRPSSRVTSRSSVRRLMSCRLS